jgi:hypothetical protein
MTLEMPSTAIEDTPSTIPFAVVGDSEDAAGAAELLESAADDGTEDDGTQLDETEQPEPAAGGCVVPRDDQPAEMGPQAEPASQPEAIAATADKPSQEEKQAKARERYLRSKANLEEHIAALTIEEAKLKAQAKRAKKEREVLTEQLSDMIDSWENGDDDGDEEINEDKGEPATAGRDAAGIGAEQLTAEENADPAGQPATDASTAATQAANDAAEQARYRKVLESASIAELRLPAKVQEKLEEAGAVNIWKLEQLRSDIALGREKWPKGIGPAKVTDIEDAIMRWMASNSDTWAPNQREAITAEDSLQAANDAVEQQQDAERAAEVTEDNPPPESVATATDDRDPLDDL